MIYFLSILQVVRKMLITTSTSSCNSLLQVSYALLVWQYLPEYRSGTVNWNTVNSKFHLIQSYCEIFFYHFPIHSVPIWTTDQSTKQDKDHTLSGQTLHASCNYHPQWKLQKCNVFTGVYHSFCPWGL